MTIKELVEKLNLQVVTEGINLQNEVSGCYICDLLSRVMSKAAPGDIWITVQTNMNTVAVASLTETACILLPEEIKAEDETIQKALSQQIPILMSKESAYALACKIKELV